MSTLTEEELIRARPLLFESRPFSRITKRVGTLAPAPPLSKSATATSTSSSSSSSSVPSAPTPLSTHAEIDLDFEHFTGVLTRLQLLLTTNAREVTRYSQEATQISLACDSARSDLIALREELAAAQTEKANRLVYDTIASDILNTRGLRPREEQEASCARLEEEIHELERERDEYEAVWSARRGQFEAIVKQLELMWAQIKEEKEEQERREGMSEEPEAEADADGEGTEGEDGEVRLEVPGGAATPAGGVGGNTPMPMAMGMGPGTEGEVSEKEEGEEDEDDDVDLLDAPVLREKGGRGEPDRMDTS